VGAGPSQVSRGVVPSALRGRG